MGYIPGSVGVIAETQVECKSMGHPPVILCIEIPVGTVVADGTRGSALRQCEWEVGFQAVEAVVRVTLDRAQPGIQPVQPNLDAGFQRMVARGLSHVVEYFRQRIRIGLVEGVRPGQ